MIATKFRSRITGETVRLIRVLANGVLLVDSNGDRFTITHLELSAGYKPVIPGGHCA